MRPHLNALEIGGARAVGIRGRYGELKHHVSFYPLRGELRHRTRKEHNRRERGALLAARDLS